MRAYLDCVEKTIKFEFENQTFTLDLTKGDLGDSWGAIKTKNGIYDTNFSWDDVPSFTIYPVIKVEDKFGGKVNSTDRDNPTSFEVVKWVGDKEDYFGVTFPNGFVSWCETMTEVSIDLFALFLNENPDMKRLYDAHGHMVYHELSREIALAFEEEHKDKEWDGEWEEEVIRFTKNYLKNK